MELSLISIGNREALSTEKGELSMVGKVVAMQPAPHVRCHFDTTTPDNLLTYEMQILFD